MQVGSRDVQAMLPHLTGGQLSQLTPEERSDKHQATAKRFEALIATQLVKELRRGLPGGFFGDGPGSDVYNGWLDSTLGESLAESWRLDLAGMVKTNLDSKQARLDRAMADSAGGAK